MTDTARTQTLPALWKPSTLWRLLRTKQPLAPELRERGDFWVELHGSGDHPRHLAAVLQIVTGLSADEAREKTTQLPCTVATDRSELSANLICARLRRAGAAAFVHTSGPTD
jgi:hypothetical protein